MNYSKLELYELYFHTIEEPSLLDYVMYKLYKHTNGKGALSSRIMNFLFKLKYGNHHTE